MSRIDRIDVRVRTPLRRLLDARPNTTASHAVNLVVDRYQALVARSLPRLTEAEWMACTAALDGIALTNVDGHDPVRMVPGEVEAAERLRGLSQKWGIDGPALVGRLWQASYAELLALLDVVERLLECPGADWSALLRAWGALLDDAPLSAGESTAPLTDDQVETLLELVKADRRADFDALCAALGVVNSSEVWAGARRRLETPPPAPEMGPTGAA